MPRYDLDALLARLQTMRRHDMIDVAEHECANAEAAGAYRRDSAGFAYAQRLKELPYWLRYGRKPQNVYYADWEKFKVLAKHLVEIGDLKPSALNEWVD